jgi:hypothetical protein
VTVGFLRRPLLCGVGWFDLVWFVGWSVGRLSSHLVPLKVLQMSLLKRYSESLTLAKVILINVVSFYFK